MTEVVTLNQTSPTALSPRRIVRRHSHPLCQETRKPPTPETEKDTVTDVDADACGTREQHGDACGHRKEDARKTMDLFPRPSDALPAGETVSDPVNGNSANTAPFIQRPGRSGRTAKSTGLFRRLSVPGRRSMFDPSAHDLSSSELSSQRSTVSSTYSSIIARNERPSVRASMIPLEDVSVDRLRNAVDDFVRAVVPENMLHAVSQHLPAFAKRYEGSLPKAFSEWRFKTIEEISEKVWEMEEMDTFRRIIPDVTTLRENPALLEKELRKLTPAGALMQSKVPKKVAKLLRHNQKKLNILQKEEKEKQEIVARKAFELAERHQQANALVRELEQQTEMTETPGGPYETLINQMRQLVHRDRNVKKTLAAFVDSDLH